jgi:hypothetical protein
MDYLGCDVLGAIPNGVNNDAAAYRTVRTSGPSLARAGDFQRFELRVGRLKIETEYSGSSSTNSSKLQKIAA